MIKGPMHHTGNSSLPDGNYPLSRVQAILALCWTNIAPMLIAKTDINISQNTVAMRLRCGDIFNDRFFL